MQLCTQTNKSSLIDLLAGRGPAGLWDGLPQLYVLEFYSTRRNDVAIVSRDELVSSDS